MIPTVLLYNLDSEKGRQIKTLCLTLKLRARSVAQEDFPSPWRAYWAWRPGRTPRKKGSLSLTSCW